MRVPEIPFAFWIDEIEAPVLLAMAESESPVLTTYRVLVALGFGLALTTAFWVGLGFAVTLGLSGIFGDGLAEGFGFWETSVLAITGAGLGVLLVTIGTALDGG